MGLTLSPASRSQLIPLLRVCCMTESLGRRAALNRRLVAGLLSNGLLSLQIRALESTVEVGENTAPQSATEVPNAVVREVVRSARLFHTRESAFKLTQVRASAPLHAALNPVQFPVFVGGGGRHIPPEPLPHTDQPLGCSPPLANQIVCINALG